MTKNKIAIWITFIVVLFVGSMLITAIKSEPKAPEEPVVPVEPEYVPDYQDVGGKG